MIYITETVIQAGSLVCDLCELRPATVRVDMPASAFLEADTLHICGRCHQDAQDSAFEHLG